MNETASLLNSSTEQHTASWDYSRPLLAQNASVVGTPESPLHSFQEGNSLGSKIPEAKPFETRVHDKEYSVITTNENQAILGNEGSPSANRVINSSQVTTVDNLREQTAAFGSP